MSLWDLCQRLVHRRLLQIANGFGGSAMRKTADLGARATVRSALSAGEPVSVGIFCRVGQDGTGDQPEPTDQ